MQEQERWAAVPGYSGYMVSDLGRVRSLQRVLIRKNGSSYTVKDKILRAESSGHPFVNIRNDEGVKHAVAVHTLVLTSFVGPKPPRHDACHGNGDERDNRLVNLRWGTRKENVGDTIRHGRHNMSVRTVCPRGHDLKEPNLRPWQLAHGRRQCLACSHAGNDIRRNGNTYTLQEAADLHYARIMQEGIGTYRRLS